jgi:hypothetical protein
MVAKITVLRQRLHSLQVYRMLKLKVAVGIDDGIEVDGAFEGPLPVCELEPSWRASSPYSGVHNY